MKNDISWHRFVGILSLSALIFFCFCSIGEAIKHWGSMMPVSYLFGNVEDYNNSNLEVYVDGTAKDVISEENGESTFTLEQDPFGLLGSIEVRTKQNIHENQTVFVKGRIENYILVADDILTKRFPTYSEIIFNLFGLFLFIHFAIKDWKVKRKFPFISELK